jgi:serine/threonine-protein kinase
MVELKENVLVAERFRLARMIGRGGMGSVWAAQDCRLDNQCAVKFIEGEIANVAEAQARFEREAKAAAQLRSPHVVEIKDYGVWQGRPYIAMELLEGEDLGKAMARAGGKLHPAQISGIIQQVCRALTKAHAAGIVHRDLKPDNIFLVNDDDRQIVKILDFGVAKQTSQAIEGSNTKTGAMLGTPYYMSPEQAQGIKSVDSRSDLWSLAVIVYHCLIGRLPFESEALGDLLVKIIVQPVPVPSQHGHVPPGFDRWWAKAADRNADNRFPTAKDFAAELAVALGSTVDTGLRGPAPMAGTALMATNLLPNPSSGQLPTATAAYSTPNPAGGMGAGFGSGMNTPNPMMMTPQGGLSPTHGLGPPMNTPPPGMQTPSAPATFSGVEPPVILPKKGPPAVALALGGFAVVAVVGVVLLFVSHEKASAGHPPTATSSIAVTATSPSAAAPTATVAADPASTAAQPEASGSIAANDAPPASASAAPSVTPPGHVAPSPHVAAPTNPVARPVVSNVAKPPAAPAASTKKWNAGF